MMEGDGPHMRHCALKITSSTFNHYETHSGPLELGQRIHYYRRPRNRVTEPGRVSRKPEVIPEDAKVTKKTTELSVT